MIPIQKGGEGRILAIDVGAGTQDIMLYDPQREPENNLKMVFPSQTQVLAKRITQIKGDVLVVGETMGGGPMAMAIKAHIKKGYKVYMTERAARTIRDDPEEVQGEGIEIISESETEDIEAARIEARDVDLDMILSILDGLGEEPPEIIGVALQDHGFEKDKSDRAFRFEKIRDTLEQGSSLKDFLYEEPPDYYSRMRAVKRDLTGRFKGSVYVVDSKFAAIAGALHDVTERPCISADLGNGHTMAALVDEGIEGVFEHHTHALTGEELADYISRFANGEVTNEEVYDDDGHGCYIKNAPGLENVKRILVTGPNRRLLSKTNLSMEFVSPYGDVMMTGPVGIVDLIKANSQG